MKKVIISLAFFSLLTVAALAQSSKEEVILVSFEQMSASKAGVLNQLTFGKPAGFDQIEKAFIVKPADESKETLNKLMEEIKYKSPDCILKIMTIEKKISTPVTK